MGAKLRRFLHLFIADLLYLTGGLSMWHSLRRRILRKQEICVLGLHRVLSEEELSQTGSLEGIVLKEATFAKLLEYLGRRFNVLSLEGLLDKESKDARRSKPICALTFDDGWRDTYTTAYPCLKKWAMPATIFVTTGLIGTPDCFWVEKLGRAWKDPGRRARIQADAQRILPEGDHVPELEGIVEYLKHMPGEKRRQLLNGLVPTEENGGSPNEVDQMMTWDQVIALSRDRIEIGSHTVTHVLLPYEDDTTIERELHLAKQTLEAKLGKPVRAFAYPNGDWDARVRQWVMQIGYECAFATRRGWYTQSQDPYTIRRVLLHEGNVTGWGGRFSPAMLNFTLARWR